MSKGGAGLKRTSSALHSFPFGHMLRSMNRPLSGGAIFLLCLFLGIIFDQVAIGILAGLVLGGATAAKLRARNDGADGNA